jgi:hypothetical protein
MTSREIAAYLIMGAIALAVIVVIAVVAYRSQRQTYNRRLKKSDKDEASYKARSGKRPGDH